MVDKLCFLKYFIQYLCWCCLVVLFQPMKMLYWQLFQMLGILTSWRADTLLRPGTTVLNRPCLCFMLVSSHLALRSPSLLLSNVCLLLALFYRILSLRALPSSLFLSVFPMWCVVKALVCSVNVRDWRILKRHRKEQWGGANDILDASHERTLTDRNMFTQQHYATHTHTANK